MEFDVNHGFHDIIFFTNEDDDLVTVHVQYDWRPQLCSKCNQIGHLVESCRAGAVRQWVPKAPNPGPNVDRGWLSASSLKESCNYLGAYCSSSYT